jgi:hypothetical protein
METFSFPNHVVKVQYPDSGDSMTLGKSYEFTSKPNAPDQRIFILSFAGMMLYLDAEGAIDASKNAAINYRAVELFYEAHRKWKTFIYPHPYLGNINVRFNTPLNPPDPIPGGNGALGGFEIQLKEQFA